MARSAFRMEVDGIQPVLDKLKRLRRNADQIAARAMQTAAMHVLVPAMKRRLRSNKSVFRGVLFQHTTSRVEHVAKGNTGKSSILVGTFTPAADYTLNIERGSRRHQPNASEQKKIREWVRLKLGLSGKVHNLVSMRIIRSIAKKGTMKQPYIVPVFKEERGNFTKDVWKRIKFDIGVQLAKKA